MMVLSQDDQGEQTGQERGWGRVLISNTRSSRNSPLYQWKSKEVSSNTFSKNYFMFAGIKPKI